MPRNEALDYLTARDLFAEIRATPGWACKHGFQEGKIGLWLRRVDPPHIKPIYLTARDQWLWVRDMVEESDAANDLTQAPLPLGGSAGDKTTGEGAGGAPTRATRPRDPHRLADSPHGGEAR